ncbi:hypothetical protein D3C73_885730 [compost metagenome]
MILQLDSERQGQRSFCNFGGCFDRQTIRGQALERCDIQAAPYTKTRLQAGGKAFFVNADAPASAYSVISGCPDTHRPARIAVLHRIIVDIGIQIRLTALEQNRIARRPPARQCIQIPRAEPHQSRSPVLQSTRISDRQRESRIRIRQHASVAVILQLLDYLPLTVQHLLRRPYAVRDHIITDVISLQPDQQAVMVV